LLTTPHERVAEMVGANIAEIVTVTVYPIERIATAMAMVFAIARTDVPTILGATSPSV
jgi:hypothetical protein